MGHMSYRRKLRKGLIPPEKQLPVSPEEKILEEKRVEILDLTREVELIFKNSPSFEMIQFNNAQQEKIRQDLKDLFIADRMKEADLKIKALKSIIDESKKTTE